VRGEGDRRKHVYDRLIRATLAVLLLGTIVSATAAAGLGATGSPDSRLSVTLPSLYKYDHPAAHVLSSIADRRSWRPLFVHPASVTVGGLKRFGVAAEDAVDLTTPAARRHILEGEARPNGTFAGGHRPGTGFPGKSEFPSGWSDDRIIHEISDVATDPASTAVQQGSRTIVTGKRGGVTIRVVIDNNTGRIVTGYPTNLPRNP
jgi:EndoU nuclease-like protein